MTRNRMKLGLSFVLFLLMGAAASAQGISDMQLFATVDQSRYGGGPRPNEGFYFAFEGLQWTISAPDTTAIGFEGLTRQAWFDDTNFVIQSNELNTGFMESEWTGGHRYELGHISGHHGWGVSGFKLNDQNQRMMSSNADMVFSDPPFGADPRLLLEGYVDSLLSVIHELPVTFDDVEANNKVELWSAELNYKYRMHPRHNGGLFELLLGGRYLQFDENFEVDAAGGILDNSFWYTEAKNRIVGPQVGLRWFRRQNRWTLGAEGRFMAGFNSQSIRQQSMLGSELVPPGGSTLIPGPSAGLPLAMGPSNANNSRHFEEWSPLAELRFDLKYQLTRAVMARVGWTGMWMDGIARPSNLVVYEVPSLGISSIRNSQDVFVSGINFGLDVNY